MHSENFDIDIPKKNCFNLIRLFCCLIVIYEHSVCLSNSNLVCLNWRTEAVNVFFILSGFWVTYSYLRSKNLTEYIKKRFIKIFPVYWFVVLFFAILLVYISTYTIKGYFFNTNFIKYIFFNAISLNFLHTWLPGVFNELPVNGSLWTIKIEISFYCILPFIIYLVIKLKNRKFLNLFIFFLIYIFSALYGVFVPLLCKKFGLNTSISYQLPYYVKYFVCGMFLFLYWKKISETKFFNLLLFFSFVLLGIIFFIKNQILYEVFSPILLSYLIIGVGTRFTFLNNIVNKDYSYYLYLIHYPVIMILNDFSFFTLSSELSILAVLGITFLLSYLIDKLYASCLVRIGGKNA